MCLGPTTSVEARRVRGVRTWGVCYTRSPLHLWGQEQWGSEGEWEAREGWGEQERCEVSKGGEGEWGARGAREEYVILCVWVLPPLWGKGSEGVGGVREGQGGVRWAREGWGSEGQGEQGSEGGVCYAMCLGPHHLCEARPVMGWVGEREQGRGKGSEGGMRGAREEQGEQGS